MGNPSGNIIGYDPGGNGKHGFAVLHVENGTANHLEVRTLADAEEILTVIEETSNLIGLGIDTMTCWSTGESGLRPADRWLREHYEEVSNSIVSPNGMYGSMGVNGMSILIKVSEAQEDLFVTETHPKVLFFALFDEKYDYENNSDQMNEKLGAELDTDVETKNDHEWDAAVSTLAVLRSKQRKWTNDLHEIESSNGERFVEPCGETHYFWPQSESEK
jgi:hypothetical protein